MHIDLRNERREKMQNPEQNASRKEEKTVDIREMNHKAALSFWISHGRKLISFHSSSGFIQIRKNSSSEMWKQVYEYIDSGYKVQ